MEINIDIMNKTDVDLELNKIKEYIKTVLVNEYKAFDPKKVVYISITFLNNEDIKQINKKHRNKNSETDVISFAYHESEMSGAVDTLGDILVSLERVKSQSKEYGHSFDRELFYVLTHGVLHLLGYDHIKKEDKKIMRKKEEEILSRHNYKR
ncbi:MAG: rRNA maturation RNase YbeY [Fusobacteriota bacterium]